MEVGKVGLSGLRAGTDVLELPPALLIKSQMEEQKRKQM